MNPATSASTAIPFVATSSVERAFAALGAADQRLLEAIVFDGHSCAQIAQAVGALPGEIRGRVGTAMFELSGAMTDGETGGGAVAAMLALRALDALDDDEAAVIDALLEVEPKAMQLYTAYREVVGELCLMVQRVAPLASVLARLAIACGCDDVTVN